MKQTVPLLVFVVLDDTEEFDPKVPFSEILHEEDGAAYEPLSLQMLFVWYPISVQICRG